MSNLYSTSGVHIVNYTRYNTEDLLALVNAVEEGLKQQGCREAGFAWTGGNQPQIVFRDYSTKIMWVRQSRYDEAANKYVSSQVRNYVETSSSWNRIGGELAVVPPGKIHEDPLEALTAMSGDGAQRIPAAMLGDLWRGLIQFYPVARETQVSPSYPNHSGTSAGEVLAKKVPSRMGVRIEDRRGEKRPASDRNAKSRNNCRQRLTSATYYAKRAKDDAERASRDIAIAERHAAKMGHSLEIDMKELEDAMSIIDFYVSSIRTKINDLPSR
jgi:hypothetical protein